MPPNVAKGIGSAELPRVEKAPENLEEFLLKNSNNLRLERSRDLRKSRVCLGVFSPTLDVNLVETQLHREGVGNREGLTWET